MHREVTPTVASGVCGRPDVRRVGRRDGPRSVLWLGIGALLAIARLLTLSAWRVLCVAWLFTAWLFTALGLLTRR